MGMSDGVDSAVASALLKREGYSVRAVYLMNAGEEELKRAERSAKETGALFEAIDIRKQLDAKVCQPFVEAYLRGRTPSPCLACNRDVKLKALIEYADMLGITNVATGHYVRKERGALFMGAPECDQSYMMALINQEQAHGLVLPLGKHSKTEIRKIASELGLDCASRPDSRENCFIRDMGYAEYIENNAAGNIPAAGKALYRGKEFDAHEGIYRYTVGQRWKNDCDGRRLYVSRINAFDNTVELCLWDELFTYDVDIEDLSWISGATPRAFENARVRIRHTRWETPECELTLTKDRVHVKTKTPLRAPAPGQTAAIYDGDRLLGGGTVASTAADYPI